MFAALEFGKNAFGNSLHLLWFQFQMLFAEVYISLALHGYEVYVCMRNLQPQYYLRHLTARKSLLLCHGNALG